MKNPEAETPISDTETVGPETTTAEEQIVFQLKLAEGGGKHSNSVALKLGWDEVSALFELEKKPILPATLVDLHEYLRGKITELSSQGLDSAGILAQLQAEKPIDRRKLNELEAEKIAINNDLKTAYEKAFSAFQQDYANLVKKSLPLFQAATGALTKLAAEIALGTKQGLNESQARYAALKTLETDLSTKNQSALQALFARFQSFSALWEQSLQIEQAITDNEAAVANTKKDPSYRCKFLAARSATPDLIQRYLMLAREEKTRAGKLAEFSAVSDQITATQALIADLRAEEERLISQLNETRQRLRNLKSELQTNGTNLKTFQREQRSREKFLSGLDKFPSASALTLLVNGKALTPNEKGAEETPDYTATEKTAENPSSRAARQILPHHAEKISKILKQTQAETIYQDLTVADIYEVLLAATENQLAERDFNLLWSYFILYKGDLSAIKTSCQHIPTLSRLLEMYFPATVQTSEEQDLNGSADEQKANLPEAVRHRLNGLKIALVASKGSHFSPTFAKNMQTVLRENQIQAEVVHLCVNEIATIPRLVAKGEINLVAIHYSFCRPPEIKTTRNTCRPAGNGNSEPDTPFLLVPYKTSVLLTLCLIAERLGK